MFTKNRGARGTLRKTLIFMFWTASTKYTRQFGARAEKSWFLNQKCSGLLKIIKSEHVFYSIASLSCSKPCPKPCVFSKIIKTEQFFYWIAEYPMSFCFIAILHAAKRWRHFVLAVCNLIFVEATRRREAAPFGSCFQKKKYFSSSIFLIIRGKTNDGNSIPRRLHVKTRDRKLTEIR